MFTDKQIKALFGIIIFIFLCFLGIKKNLYFIQSTLTFASVSLLIVTTIFAILCNSNIPSELHYNPKYKHGDTTGWEILTRDLQQYMHRLLKLIILALVVLIFPNSYTVFWYLDIVLWYYFLVCSFFLMLRTHSLINISIYALQFSAKKP
ncbi:hypothetical protein [Bartonella henselae]|uniref:hypothetical protein n=1 Tax=Bartonella henselae TaxID=38323 RepID=UPI0003DF8741|nr:hypothetical protein [Bartonella henselae]ETS11153.1 hypothetical protein Q653_00067 [Bartonella henselae JK 42]ETS12002.1 hypothetical protein Q652_01341 [Bartonella henselae JK 41]KEC54068.1 hypothetical protein O97_01629 [Bartonella henselae str. Zeus]KEC57881.1 hypothetical protein O95_01564 [Bartonella henselae JK 53]KEC62203.1 hypothetical protein O95_00665 [Bartonella henselae JK 53]